MNRYHRPVLNVGSNDKKIFLKSASKKRKVSVFFAILLIIACVGIYKIKLNGSQVNELNMTKNLPINGVEKMMSEFLKQTQTAIVDTYTNVKQKIQERQDLKHEKIELLVHAYAEDENISKIVLGQSWLGQTLVEKHSLSDFVTVKLKKFYQVNRNAYILSETSKGKLGMFPILSGPWSHKENHALSEDDRSILAQGVELVALFNQHNEIKNILSEVNYNNDYGWVLFSTSPGMTITLGKYDFKVKIDRLRKVLQQYGDNVAALKSIDLDYEQLAIIKLRKGDQHGQS